MLGIVCLRVRTCVCVRLCVYVEICVGEGCCVCVSVACMLKFVCELENNECLGAWMQCVCVCVGSCQLLILPITSICPHYQHHQRVFCLCAFC